MTGQKPLAVARRKADRIHRSLGDDVRRFREDAGASRRQLAELAGIDHSYLRRIEDGRARASINTYAKLADALSSDLSARLYPNTGPAKRDRHQARILEALLSELHPEWKAYAEVAVRHPSRGWIDAVLHAERGGDVVAVEIQSNLRRVEQLLRWFPEKVASLPSWEGWAQLGETRAVSQLLIVRSTKATRLKGREFRRQLVAAYPVHPADAIYALTGRTRWPGPAMLWAEIEPRRVRFITRRLFPGQRGWSRSLIATQEVLRAGEAGQARDEAALAPVLGEVGAEESHLSRVVVDDGPGIAIDLANRHPE
jgi:transcriptional regulator with XRE-family HTH domain